jgi:hypothetical protein
MHGATALHRYVQDWLDTFEEITSVPRNCSTWEMTASSGSNTSPVALD